MFLGKPVSDVEPGGELVALFLVDDGEGDDVGFLAVVQDQVLWLAVQRVRSGGLLVGLVVAHCLFTFIQTSKIFLFIVLCNLL